MALKELLVDSKYTTPADLAIAARAEVGLSVLVHNMLSLLTALQTPSKTLAPRPPP